MSENKKVNQILHLELLLKRNVYKKEIFVIVVFTIRKILLRMYYLHARALHKSFKRNIDYQNSVQCILKSHLTYFCLHN